MSFRSYFGSISALLKNRVLQALLAISVVRSMGLSAIQVFLPVYLREDLEFSPAKVAVYLSLAQVVGVGAQPAMGYLSDRFGRKAVLLPAMTALGLLFLALRFADPGVQLLLTILCLGGFLYSLHEISIAAAMDVSAEDVQATAASLIYGASFIGAISPVIAGAIVDASGATSDAFLYGGAMALLGAAVLSSLKLTKPTAHTV